MLYNYKSFSLILESKRDKKIEKQKKKIGKFLKFESIVDYIFEKVVDRDSTKGLQYTVWFADKIKKRFIKYIIDEKLLHNMSMKIDGKRISELKEDDINSILDDFLAGKDGKLSKKIWLKTLLKKTFENYKRGIDQHMVSILDWLKSPIREEEEVDLSQYNTLSEAYERSEEWHRNIKATGVIEDEDGEILLTFKDGYYWIDYNQQIVLMKLKQWDIVEEQV